MIGIDLPDEQAELDQVILRLAQTARSSGLDVAGGFLEALRDALSKGQSPRFGGN